MKTKTTRNIIMRTSTNVKCAGYCDLQALLRNHSPLAYNAGIYGWNFDVYEVYGVTICTGYRNMPGARCKGISEFEEKAAAIWSNYNDYKGVEGFDRQQNEVENLLKEFCKLNGGYDYE